LFWYEWVAIADLLKLFGTDDKLARITKCVWPKNQQRTTRPESRFVGPGSTCWASCSFPIRAAILELSPKRVSKREIARVLQLVAPDRTQSVFPSVLKGAFVVGGSYGRGAMTWRRGENFNGAWGAPSMTALEGGSVGFQIGGQATDFVLLVMNDRGANGILSSKEKLGADASVAVGPVGRNATAETDVSMRAEILSYSRAHGLFAGISLEGSTIRPDNDADALRHVPTLRLARDPRRIDAKCGDHCLQVDSQGTLSVL
jgi:lipid-binding SYLF domain-containing protein